MLRVLAFAYPYTWDSLPIFSRVRARLQPLSACWKHQGINCVLSSGGQSAILVTVGHTRVESQVLLFFF